MDFKKIRTVVRALNKTDLLEENIKSTGVTKEALTKSFLQAVADIPEKKAGKDDENIPDDVLEAYNELNKMEDPPPEKEKKNKNGKKANGKKKASKEDMKAAKAKAKDKSEKKVAKVSERAKKSKVLIEWLTKMIEKGKHTRKELVELAVEKFDANPSTVSTRLSDGKNPKYNSFDKLIIQEEDGKVHFDTKKK